MRLGLPAPLNLQAICKTQEVYSSFWFLARFKPALVSVKIFAQKKAHQTVIVTEQTGGYVHSVNGKGYLDAYPSIAVCSWKIITLSTLLLSVGQEHVFSTFYLL
jgi:hypothetical protein